MRRKQKKTKEEKIAENFFPVDPGDLKKTIEKKYKKPERKSLEKVEKIKKPKRKYRKKTKAKKKEFKIPKIKLKPKGYELIITEKPQAALKIASFLGKSVKKSDKNIPYYEVDRNGKKIVVACAVGHLFTLSQNTPGAEIPVFGIGWMPNYIVRTKDFSKKYYDVLLKLVKKAGSLTVATDYDVEGEVIGLNVVRFIGGQEDANRMKFSTLTEKEIDNAYEEKNKSIDWGQAIAGETRHYLDWFYGINLSRALMNAIKTTGKFRIMSIGRVQGPALNLIVKREKEIQAFKTTPYWQVLIKIKDPELELIHNKDIFNKSELKKFENLVGKKAQAETKKTEQHLAPNPPFNLTTLQTEAYRFYGISPSKTLAIAQSLYLAGLISYPRTSSQKLPASINYKDILKKLAKKYHAERLINRKKPVEGKRTDPAHPSIYPTGNFQILSGDYKKIYDLIVNRFLSLFCEDAIIENKKVNVKADELLFVKKGSAIRKKSWIELYPTKLIEKEVPDVNGEVEITDSRIEEKETQPPKRYSPASIISQLEKKNLGTKATRAAILETLYNRGYIKDKSIRATPLGISLIETLEKHSPIIIDEELTKSFEKGMESIRESKKDYRKKEEKIINKAKETITKISDQFKKEEKDIGRELLSANLQLREEQKKENTLNVCPVCKKGSLAITYSKKTRRHFVACDAYPNCKTTFSLPPNGSIKKTDNVCEECGFPRLMLLKKGRKPWVFCFNPQCPTNKERIERYRKKQAENNNN
jgi:DNA topoisomerase-1